MKSKTKWGTSHFISYTSARNYYSKQGESREAVDRKIEEKLITIGKPDLKPGERLIVNFEEGRYFIES